MEFSTTVIESAAKWERPVWQQAIELGVGLFRQGLVDAFLFGRVDRETRNLFASIPILRMAIDAGVSIYFAQEKLYLDTKEPESIDKYLREAQDATAYIRRLVKNTVPGRIERAKLDQKHPSNTKMFGFDLIDGKRIPKIAEAAALRKAAQISLRQGRTGPAARWLNEQGFRTTNGKEFAPASLRELFSNSALVGETIINFKDETVIIHHEPIFDRSTFEQLQAVLDERRLRAQRSEKAFYALTGMSFCGCGKRFEANRIVNDRYYRCEGRCGERAWRKDELEYEAWDAFSLYLEQRESQRQYLELSQQSQAKLEKELARVEGSIVGNNRQWKMLLEKELSDYPDNIIPDKKRELTAERESLLREKTKIYSELAALPQVDPDEVERALAELRQPWQRANAGGYYIPYPMAWERRSIVEGTCYANKPRKLTEEQAHLLRETLLKLNCRIVIRNRAVFISAKLWLGVGAKVTAS